MVLDACMLHPELATGVSGMAHAHGVRVEDVSLGKLQGARC